MRYVVLAVSAVISLSSMSAGAAVRGVPSQDGIVAYNSCPVYEGYPDCHPDSEPAWTPYSGRLLSAPARGVQRRTGALRVAHEVSNLRRR
jgi:hypothetical protein